MFTYLLRKYGEAIIVRRFPKIKKCSSCIYYKNSTLSITYQKIKLLNPAYHSGRIHPFIELFGRKQPGINGCLLQRFVFTKCFLGNRSCFIITDLRIECRHQHQGVVQMFLYSLFYRLDTDSTMVVETPATITDQPRTVQKIINNLDCKYHTAAIINHRS